MNQVDASTGIALRTVDHVEIHLAIAGLGARAYAYAIDWHIRILVSLLAAALAWLLAWMADASHSLMLIVCGLAAALPFIAYHAVLEIVQQGRTPGKRIAGIRIVTETGEVAGAGPILVRNVFRVVDCLPGFYSVGVITMFFTARQSRLGDLASGTLVIYEDQLRRSTDDLIGSAKLSPQDAMLVRELIERWPELEVPVRRKLAQQLLQRLGVEHPPMDASELHRALKQQLESLAA